MFEVLSSDSQLREPVLVAVLVVLIAYIITQYFKTKGCPFAQPSKTAPKATSMSNPAPGSLRLTLAQLAEYDGQDPSKPLYIAVRGQIYDVTAGKTFYGPGG